MGSKENTQEKSKIIDRRRVLQTSAVGLLSGLAVTGAASPVAGQEEDEEEEDEEEEDEEEEDEEEEDEEEEDEEEEDEEESNGPSCEGAPTMSRTSVTTPNSRITRDDPAVVEANFRPDPTVPDDCTIMVDLEFSFADAGFQWGGGAEWDQATSDLVVGQFEVRPGEVRDIRAQLHTQGAEEGDSVTVTADYEIWYEGSRDQSVQQSGIRHTIEVEEPNPTDAEPGEDEDEASFDEVPGFGITSALAGLGGAAYMLKSRLSENSE